MNRGSLHTRGLRRVHRGGGGGTNQILIRGGSARRSNPLPFYIPFWQKSYPFYIHVPFIEKRYPFHIPTLGRSCSHFHVVLNK